MNIPAAVWLRGYLQNEADPKTFNYGSSLLAKKCGCAAWHVVKAGKYDASGMSCAKEVVFEQFLSINHEQANSLWIGYDGRTAFSDDDMPCVGVEGIASAIRSLDYIASLHGVDLKAEAAKHAEQNIAMDPAPPSTFQPDEAAFLAACRAVVKEAVQ